MTVLSRSKNAAARVTRHDCKWTGSERRRCRAPSTPVRVIHSLRRRSGTVCPLSRWARRVSTARTPPARPLVVSADEELLDDLLRLLAAAGAEPELATGGPALRRAHRDAPLVLLGADALTGGAVRALPRRPGRGRRLRAAAAGHRLGRGGRGRRGTGGGAARRTRPGCCPGRPPPRRRPPTGDGWSPWAAAAGAPGRARWPPRWRWPRRPACCSSTPIRGVRGSTCSWAPSAPRGCAGRSSPGCAGGWTATRCWPPCPRSAGCTSSPRPGRRPRPVPDDALAAVRRGGAGRRSAGRGGPARARAAGGRPPRRCSPTPTSRSWWSRPGCGRPPPRGCWWRRRAPAGRRPGSWSGRWPAASPGTRWPTSWGGRSWASCRTTAAPCRAGSAASRPPSRRAPRWELSPGGSSTSSRPGTAR